MVRLRTFFKEENFTVNIFLLQASREYVIKDFRLHLYEDY